LFAHVPLREVDIGLLADQVGVAATNTLDLGQGVHDLLLAVNIGVEQTQDVLEVRLLAGHERCSHRQVHVSLTFNFVGWVRPVSLVTGEIQRAVIGGDSMERRVVTYT
jgi:hypothetical protein